MNANVTKKKIMDIDKIKDKITIGSLLICSFVGTALVYGNHRNASVFAYATNGLLNFCTFVLIVFFMEIKVGK